jgi:16S rRNA (cytidine1402-2'-O)-methyltransferase
MSTTRRRSATRSLIRSRPATSWSSSATPVPPPSATRGLEVTTAPGPSAVIAALTISGLATERFCMEGFLPRKAGDRERLYAQWTNETRTVIFYESPHRLSTTLTEMMGLFGDRRVAVAREITKLHEEVLRGTVRAVAEIVASREILGEIVVVLEGAGPARSAQSWCDDPRCGLVRRTVARRRASGRLPVGLGPPGKSARLIHYP